MKAESTEEGVRFYADILRRLTVRRCVTLLSGSSLARLTGEGRAVESTASVSRSPTSRLHTTAIKFHQTESEYSSLSGSELAGMSNINLAASSDNPSFSIDDSLGPWNTTAKGWLLRNQEDNKYSGVATGNIVFDCRGRVLIVQRASHDSLPDRWEFPGGAVDDGDATILHAAARELWEEAGLNARRFTHVVAEGHDQLPGEIFRNRTKTKVFIRFAFHVEVESCDGIKLDPNEHQDFAWASEEEIREQKIGNREIPITRPSVQALFLEAFRLRKKRAESL